MDLLSFRTRNTVDFAYLVVYYCYIDVAYNKNAYLLKMMIFILLLLVIVLVNSNHHHDMEDMNMNMNMDSSLPSPIDNLVILVGLPKSGTTSIFEALLKLGVRSNHHHVEKVVIIVVNHKY